MTEWRGPFEDIRKECEEFLMIDFDEVLNDPRVRVSIPKNNTTISLNVSGKSVREAAREIAMLGWILKNLANTDESVVDSFEFRSADGNCPRPMPHLTYKEWEWDDDDDTTGDFTSSNLILGYRGRGDVVRVLFTPEFVEWARTDKPIDEYCISEINACREAIMGRMEEYDD